MNRSNYTVQQVSWQQQQQALATIRRQVFIEEQNVPESLEWDGEDNNAFHLLAVDHHSNPIGCVRMLKDGHIGRMAVIKPWRQQGVGSCLLTQMIELAAKHAIKTIELDAQCHAISFYQRHGFTIASDEFLDAGIPHQKMTRSI